MPGYFLDFFTSKLGLEIRWAGTCDLRKAFALGALGLSRLSKSAHCVEGNRHSLCVLRIVGSVIDDLFKRCAELI